MEKQNMVNKLIWCAISGIIGTGIGFYFDFITNISPNVRAMDGHVRAINGRLASIDRQLSIIIGHYLKKDEEGCACIVGVSSDMDGNCVSVNKGNRLNLKSGDIIFITNPYGKFTPTVKFQVYLVENNVDEKSMADLYVSKEGISKLDISPQDVKRKGVFHMTMLRESPQK